MIYHLFNSGVYFNNFHRFMCENSQSIGKEQHFLILDTSSLNNENTESCIGFIKLFNFFWSLKREDKVIIHSYSSLNLWLLCFIFQYKLSSFSWYIWGADLYFYKIAHSSIKFRIFEFLRCKTIPKFKNVIVSVVEDYELAKSIYKLNGCMYCTQYPNYGIVPFYKKNEKKSTGILLGNSADPSNNHILALDLISHFAKENIKVFIPLSYGGNSEYIRNVISYGKKIFGDNLIPMTEILPYEQYIQFLKKIDIMLCFHDRQQALGNLWVVLSNGRKVFIKESVTTYSFMKKLGLDIYSTLEIDNNIEKFRHMPIDSSENNNRIVNEIFSRDAMISTWVKIYAADL